MAGWKVIPKRKMVIITAAILLINVVFIGLIITINNRKDEGITYGEAAKMLAYAIEEDSQINENEINVEGYWYEPYAKIVYDKGILNIKDGNQFVTWQDVYNLYNKIIKGALVKEDQSIKGIVIDDEITELIEKNKTCKKQISRKDFIRIYMIFIAYMPYGNGIEKIDAGIAGTPLMLEKAGEWEVYTTKGKLRFKGMILDDKIDTTMSLIVKNNEILSVVEKVSDMTEYKNIWIKSYDGSLLETNIYGADRTFKVKNLSQNVQSVLADIGVKDGKVKHLNIKTDEVGGKVLSVTKEYVELEGYGKVPLDSDFMIYDISEGFNVKTYEDIVVGYSLQNFIVAEGNICGAVISKPLSADCIRVLVKTTGFDNIFHDNTVITSNQPFSVLYGEEAIQYQPGQQVAFSLNSPEFLQGRITVEAQNDGSIEINTISRGYGIASYEGKIELSLCDEGIIIVNEIDIEKYLKRVVPSEMPVGFGVEALKVQAVCARSYAYNQLTNSYYSMYGAHVDDSTQFQVYNNTFESEASNQAIDETKGQVLKYNSAVVQTYYYSTSCGETTDVGLWGSDPVSYPYFASIDVSRIKKNLNLCDENTFEQFITSKDENDYDYNCDLYRWKLDVSKEDLSRNFNAKLYGRYLAVPDKVLSMNEDGSFSSKKITTVGDITSIIVNERANGGAVTSITIEGTLATVQINSESCIRVLFGMADTQMITNTGTATMASLPSTFCIFRKKYENGIYTGYQIIGGGYGHGIGMSQNAVNTMAAEGMNYGQILTFFYPGTQVGNYH